MSSSPQVELTIGLSQIEAHPLMKGNWGQETIDTIDRETRALFKFLLGEMQREIVPTIAVGASGNLKKSFRAEPVRGKGIELTGLWGTAKKYAPYREWGTGPHFPPIDKPDENGRTLMEWVVAKGTFTDAKGNVIDDSSPRYVIRGAAFLVARAISRRGTIPGNEREKWLMENEVKTINKIMTKLDDLMERAYYGKI